MDTTVNRNPLPLVLILTTLTGAFFAAGIWLDLNASHYALANLTLGDQLGPDQFKDILSVHKDQINNLQKGATAAYDIAKISLGALVSTTAQLISGSRPVSTSTDTETT